MKLFWDREAKKKAALFRALARDVLVSMEKERWPSCESVVMSKIDEIIKASKEDFASFPPGYNYEELVLNVIGDVTFREVVSGQYHFYAGQLKPIGVQLKEVCVQSAYRAKNKGYLSEDEYYSFLDRLSDGIHSVG
ncbi:MAG: hypothetical protein ACI3W5_12495 [Faecousia sp.]